MILHLHYMQLMCGNGLVTDNCFVLELLSVCHVGICAIANTSCTLINEVRKMKQAMHCLKGKLLFFLVIY